MKTYKQQGVTLPWMNKIRTLNHEGCTALEIVAKLYMYGLEEEKRISDAFKKDRKEWRKQNGKNINRQ